MNKLEKVTTESAVAVGITQPTGARRQVADLVIGGLLVAIAIGGFAM
jgi:hypothetical protein